jgi:site-specific DNA recombinase
MLIVNPGEARRVRAIYKMYLKHGTLSAVWDELQHLCWRSKSWRTEAGVIRGGNPTCRC